MEILIYACSLKEFCIKSQKERKNPVPEVIVGHLLGDKLDNTFSN